MKQKDRDAVVELLRCAADLEVSIGIAAEALLGEPWGESSAVSDAALDAAFAVRYAMWRSGRYDGCRSVYLEAALRVETGEWP